MADVATATTTTTGNAATVTADAKAAQAEAQKTTAQAATAKDSATAAAASSDTLIGGKVDGNGTETTYTLELPKDSLLGTDAIERTTATARSLGLSDEQAKAVLKQEAEGVKAYVDRQQAEFVQVRDKWFKEVEADKVLGGENFKANVAAVKAFSDKYLSKETRQFLNESGFGNHPKLFSDLLKLAKASGNDKAVHGQTTTVAKPKSDYEKLFPASVGGQAVTAEE